MTSASHSIDQDPTPSDSRADTGPIVVAVGGVNVSRVLRAAELLSRGSDRKVIVLAVLERLPVYGMGIQVAMGTADFDDEREGLLLAQRKGDVERAVGTHASWSVRVVYGEPSRTIAEVAQEEKASLIVMGIGRHTPLDRVLGAEATLRTVRRASCPVFAVGSTLDALPHEVVIATDFSPASARAAQLVLPLLGARASLHFVHAWQPIELVSPRAREIDAAYQSAISDGFDRFVKAVSAPADSVVTVDTVRGNPAEGILDFANEHAADLIVAGREGLGRIERLLLGSVSATLLRGATCSVFIARQPASVDVHQLQRLLSGRSQTHLPEQWSVELNAFTRRNAGRRIELQSTYPTLVAATQESGFSLLGTVYDLSLIHI